MDYRKLFDLSGKVAIVTGGAGYLGSENVKALKDFGATVVLTVNPGTNRNKDDIPACDMVAECDIASTESIKNCFKAVYEKYGKIDVLVNCAVFGGAHGEKSQLEFMDDETWEKGIDGTINATFRCTREVIKYMKENGGSIINYSSMYGMVSPDLSIYSDKRQRQAPNYGTGKAGVLQFSRYAAADLAEYNIRVNCVTPGPCPKPSNQTNPEFMAKLAAKTMLKRFGKSYEIAGAVLLLASDASTFMTGSNIVIDGGWTAW